MAYDQMTTDRGAAAGPASVSDAPATTDSAAKLDIIASPDAQAQAQVPPPTIPGDLKDWTQRWHEETSASPLFKANVDQYEQDLAILFPGDYLRKTNQVSNRGGSRRTRRETRTVAVPRVFQYSQQTLALLCPGDLSFKIEAREEIPPMGAGFPNRAGTNSRDPFTEQFARTMDDRLWRHIDACGFIDVLRDWARHSIWFRAGIFKLGYQRDLSGMLMRNRLPDTQDGLARFQYLLQCYLRGDFCEQDGAYLELANLAKSMGTDGVVEVWQNLVCENIPLNQYICDANVTSLVGLRNARWQGDISVMTGSEILERWPYDPAGDGTWKGVHPDDLKSAVSYESDSTKALLESARRRQERERNASSQFEAKDGDKDRALEDRLFLVKEIWAACEGHMVFWLVDGLDYPTDTWYPPKQPRGWWPYYVHSMNPQPGTWSGRSDTEQQGPTQDRINRKKSDQEIARWLSMGGRGVVDTSVIDGSVVEKLRNLKPGELLKLNLNGADIQKALMWLITPYNKEAFDTSEDEADERLTHHLPQAALGVTDDKTTATAIQTANQGSQVAFNDRQFEFNRVLERILTGAADIVVQEDRPEDVRRESGPHALWPKVYKNADAMKIMQAIYQRVNQQVTNEAHGAIIQAQMTGDPTDVIALQKTIDERISQLTEQECLKAFGTPEPMTRESLFERVQLRVHANMNGQMDRERRVMMLTKLLQQLVGLGVQVNVEPIARIISGLMGEQDAMGDLIKPDPNQLISMLQQIAQTDPSGVTPQSAVALAKMGDLAKAYLARMQATGGQPAAPGGQPPADAPAGQVPPPPASSAAAPASAPTSSGQVSAAARTGNAG